MTHINNVTLVGRIGSCKFSKTVTAKEFVYISLEVDVRPTADSTPHSTIHVRCFKPNVVKYLRDVGAREGHPAIVFGSTSSYSSEFKGQNVLNNVIIATDIYIIKTQK